MLIRWSGSEVHGYLSHRLDLTDEISWYVAITLGTQEN